MNVDAGGTELETALPATTGTDPDGAGGGGHDPPLVVVGFSATSTNVHDASSDSVNVVVPDAPTVA